MTPAVRLGLATVIALGVVLVLCIDDPLARASFFAGLCWTAWKAG